jgi:S-DNA-T family DNA segregation ATPase FtsK/SpoIIIE
LLLALFVGLSLLSYDWEDVSVYRTPPNSPACNWFGVVGAWGSFVLFSVLGLGAAVVPVAAIVLGLHLLVGQAPRVWPRLAWGGGFLLALAAVLQTRGAALAQPLAALNLADAGGFLGWLLSTQMLVRWISPVGTALLCWSALAVTGVMFVGPAAWVAVGRGLLKAWAWIFGRVQEYQEEREDERERIEREERDLERKRREIERELRRQERINRVLPKPDVPAPPAPTPEPEPEPRPVPEVAAAALQPEEVVEIEDEVEDAPAEEPKPEPRKPFKPKVPPPAPPAEPEAHPAPSFSSYRLPSLDLLETPKARAPVGAEDVETISRILKETLAEFGIEVEVTNVEIGPVVTSYELLPPPGVRVERIQSLSNTLALNLKATSVRVQAPIPGKGVVGIEVPNVKAHTVYLREILEGDAWRSGKARLPLALGKDVGGDDIVADLTDMPHLLIAGATGSGKTVCMNSILAGLLMSKTPEELRLLLVDPKIVEFSSYCHLPHLAAPVITDPKKVAIGLRWAIAEMEKRYKLFARVGVRNIESFNKREVAKQESLFTDPTLRPAPADDTPARLPYIVVVVDELADLMLVAQADIENAIARLAQLSRAVGIHMILATQRPSVNVITGTIKANFPARIAFQVAQKVDSRTILDAAGADDLLGKGDMLFQPAGANKMVRTQGALTTDAEIRRITEAIREQSEPAYELEIKQSSESGAESEGETLEGEADDEDMLSQAVEIIRETHRASTSSLQRRLRIGYTRAARIMDILEERGIVGPPRGSDPREILIDLDGDIPNNSPASEQ